MNDLILKIPSLFLFTKVCICQGLRLQNFHFFYHKEEFILCIFLNFYVYDLTNFVFSP